MVAIPRKTQKVFGGSLTPSGNIGVIGSLAAGSPAYSGDLSTLQSLSNYLGGFASCTVGNSSPTMQDMNALFYLITTQLDYILQRGLPEWDAGTTYFTGCRVSSGSTSYVSLQDNNTNHSVTDGAWWSSTSLGQARAWVTFDQTGAILQSYNIASVVRNSTGRFTITMSTPCANINYAVSGVTSGEAGQYARVLALDPRITRTTTAFDITTTVSQTAGYCDCVYNSVQIFGN